MGRTRAQDRAILAPTAFCGNVGESQALKPVLAGVPQKAAAAFGRLCVETRSRCLTNCWHTAAAFGRLCVETFKNTVKNCAEVSSRLRAAVC